MGSVLFDAPIASATSNMSDIFISYARSTTAVQAQAMADALRALGYDVWFDEALPAHRDFGDVLAERLRTAKAVVVIWSDEAVKSQWVRSEANRAREAGKLVQLVIDDAAIPMPFDQIHCADMKGWSGDTQAPGWKKVVASITDLLGAPRVATIGNAQTSTLPIRKNSICVLPFVNMSGDAEQEYFSDGITEDIITDLSKVSALFVIARNTAFTFKAKSVDVSQVARQLNVSHVLEGSVRKAGGRVRITAQLIDGSTGGHVWAERYDRDLNDIFALQDEIAHAIVAALKVRLLPGEKKGIERRGTSNLDAYDLYLRGTRVAFGPEEKRARIAELEAAVALEPSYALAWGALANARAQWSGERPYRERNEIDRVVAADAKRALELDPNNLDALAAQFQLLPWFGSFLKRDAVIKRMEEIYRSEDDAVARRTYFLWQARHLVTLGRMRDAVEATQSAYEADPLDPYVGNLRGRNLSYAGRHIEARSILRNLLASWPDHHYLAINLLIVCIHLQDWETVDELLAPERLARYPLREFERAARFYVSTLRDSMPRSRQIAIDAARRLFEASGLAYLQTLQVVAKVGFADEAHSIALRAKFGPVGDEHDLIGFDQYTTKDLFSAVYPEFRRDPRFVKLCARLSLVDYWRATQHWPDCVDEVAPYYDFKAECEKVAAEPPLPPADEVGSAS